MVTRPFHHCVEAHLFNQLHVSTVAAGKVFDVCGRVFAVVNVEDVLRMSGSWNYAFGCRVVINGFSPQLCFKVKLALQFSFSMSSLRFASLSLHRNLRSAIQCSFASNYSTRFVPPISQENVQELQPESLARPESKAFYTGRPRFYDHISSLEQAVHHTRRILMSYHLIPLPDFARQSLPPLSPIWKTKEQLSIALDAKLSATSYRRMLDLLNDLNDFRNIADTAGHHDLGRGIESILGMFEKSNKEAHLRRGKRKPVPFDEYGRTYTLGKRKTSSARVWMITSKHSIENLRKMGAPSAPPTTQILVNDTPLNVFFSSPRDRERVLRPFTLTGLLGAYHVFAIVRGGGTSGQSGAVSHGIAKGLLAHEPDVELILRRGQFLSPPFLMMRLTHLCH